MTKYQIKIKKILRDLQKVQLNYFGKVTMWIHTLEDEDHSGTYSIFVTIFDHKDDGSKSFSFHGLETCDKDNTRVWNNMIACIENYVNNK